MPAARQWLFYEDREKVTKMMKFWLAFQSEKEG